MCVKQIHVTSKKHLKGRKKLSLAKGCNYLYFEQPQAFCGALGLIGWKKLA